MKMKYKKYILIALIINIVIDGDFFAQNLKLDVYGKHPVEPKKIVETINKNNPTLKYIGSDNIERDLKKVDNSLNGEIRQINDVDSLLMASAKIESGKVKEYITYSQIGTIYCHVEFEKPLEIKTLWKLLQVNEKIYPSWDIFFKATLGENTKWVHGLNIPGVVSLNFHQIIPFPEETRKLIKYHDELIFSHLENYGGNFKVYDLKIQLRVEKNYKVGSPSITIYKEYYDHGQNEIYSITKMEGEKIISKRNHIKDEKEYFLQLFHDNNSIKSEGHIKKGYKEGTWKIYDNEGRVLKKEKYKKGELVKKKGLTTEQ